MTKSLITPFNKALVTGSEQLLVQEVIDRKEFSGGGYYTQACEHWLENYTQARKVLLTSSCTHALEMCALLCDIQAGDEVIMASYNFVSAANAFVLRGARIRFVDIDPVTMNIDANLARAAISPKTKAILVMHYGGTACDMTSIMQMAEEADLWVIEDAAHCIGAFYEGKHLGTIGHLGTLSFHATKNIHCGEGGALFINDNRFALKAEMIREKGTNRNAFLRGEVDKYTWTSIGSSYLMSELTAAFLYAQLKHLHKVTAKRKFLWNIYFERLESLKHLVGLPKKMDKEESNAHLFFLKIGLGRDRDEIIRKLKICEHIQCTFHYVPLHTSQVGTSFGCFEGEDNYTTAGSEAIVRLPLYYDLTAAMVEQIAASLSRTLQAP